MLEIIKTENLHTNFLGFDHWNFEFIWNLEFKSPACFAKCEMKAEAIQFGNLLIWI